MKLIIDIPKEVVVAIENGFDYRYDIHTAIAQGIPYEEGETYTFEQVQELVKLNQQFAQEIENLKRPQGRWIRYRDNSHQPEHIKCSNCGQYWSVADHDKIFDICFKCGANMRGGKNES